MRSKGIVAVVAGVLALGGSEAAAAERFSRAVSGDAVPVALAGDRAYTLEGDSRRTVTEVTAEGLSPLVTAKDLRTVSASSSMVVVGAGRDGVQEAGALGRNLLRSSVLAGAPGKRPREVLRCGPSPLGYAAPVAVGADAAYRSCDGSSVVAGPQTLPAGGPVVALAATGRRLAWLESRGGAPAALVTVDLDTGVRSEVPFAEPVGVAPGATLAVDRGGRARVTLPVGGFSTDCRSLVSAGGGAFAPVDDPSCDPVALLDDGGEAGVLVADASQQLALRPAGGGAARVIARVRGERPVFQGPARPGAATDGSRLAYTRRDCRTSRLIVTTPGRARTQTALPSCPVRITTRSAILTRGGGFFADVRCPRGCRIAAADVFVPGGEEVEDAGASLVGDPVSRRGRAEVPVLLNDVAEGAVRDRGRARLSLTLTGFDGRTVARRVTVRLA